MNDLFGSGKKGGDYTAKDIEVLEGLEPVRRRPGMYIGGTDERALHHLVAEILDNSMDEAVAGHASRIEVELAADGYVTVRDNGRGIPIDPMPKYGNKPAVEVILTTLHSGGKFGGKVYETSGGLHGVGMSVVNALSDDFTVEVARGKELYVQSYSKGKPKGKLKNTGARQPARHHRSASTPTRRSSASRRISAPTGSTGCAGPRPISISGVEIRWSCDAKLITGERQDARPKRRCISPAASPTSSPPISTAGRPSRRRPSTGKPAFPTNRAGSNGRSPGRRHG